MSSQVQVQFSLLQESPTFLRKLTFFITIFVSRLGRYFLLKKIYKKKKRGLGGYTNQEYRPTTELVAHSQDNLNLFQH